MESLILNIEQKKVLINIAQETIGNVVGGKNPANYDIEDHILNMKCGAFVTLHLNKNLRGCIGNIVAEIPLWKTVRNMAKESALNDPRFPPVSPAELNEINIEISVLSPLEKILDINEIKVGTHGILIKHGFNQGLLLPQVATDYNWNRIQFLEYTCRKAGLGTKCYKDKNCEIFIFSATIFDDKVLKRRK
jgi:AmmeMemoRadiSam system protein A